MQLLNRLIGDQLRSKYGNTKFYIKQISIAVLKSIFIFGVTMTFFMIFFLILKPNPTQIRVNPVFQVKKSNDKSMISIYTNQNEKPSFCQNQSLIYFGKLYTKQQYCQFEHQYFPFQIAGNNQVDATLQGSSSNVQYITACLVKINQDRSVCQKFAYIQEVKIFNNLILENLYSIEIQLNLKDPHQWYGEFSILFEQQNAYIIKLLKKYYFFVSILTSIFMSVVFSLSFAIFQIPEVLQKGEKLDRKIKDN